MHIAMLAGQGLTAREIAAILNKGIPTVRTQLAAVFLKTGARRQSELVRLLANFDFA
jgi:DNA-binding CsgD family transcriptional regulator